MIRSIVIRTLLLVSLSVVSSLAGAQEHSVNRGIPGTLDPLTGQFKPMMPPVDESFDTAAATTFGGTLVFKFSVSVKSTIPSTETIVCEANADIAETTGNSYEEVAAVAATRGTGTATCTVNIPYSWALASASTDHIIMSYSVGAGNLVGSSVALPIRVSSHNLTPIAVPANGATTTTSISATI